jgi:hypothetical protein
MEGEILNNFFGTFSKTDRIDGVDYSNGLPIDKIELFERRLKTSYEEMLTCPYNRLAFIAKAIGVSINYDHLIKGTAGYTRELRDQCMIRMRYPLPMIDNQGNAEPLTNTERLFHWSFLRSGAKFEMTIQKIPQMVRAIGRMLYAFSRSDGSEIQHKISIERDLMQRAFRLHIDILVPDQTIAQQFENGGPSTNFAGIMEKLLEHEEQNSRSLHSIVRSLYQHFGEYSKERPPFRSFSDWMEDKYPQDKLFIDTLIEGEVTLDEYGFEIAEADAELLMRLLKGTGKRTHDTGRRRIKVPKSPKKSAD